MFRRQLFAATLVIAAACDLGVVGSPTNKIGESPPVGTKDDAGPVSEWGIDVRPANPSCRPPVIREPGAPRTTFRRVFANVQAYLNVGMAQPPGDKSRWFAASLDGKIYSFPVKDPPDAPRVTIDLKQHAVYPVVNGGECGLFGLAFHPKFQENGYIFVTYTTSGGPVDTRSIVARLTTRDGGLTFDELKPIIGPFDQPSVNHNGGGIAFGHDGYLYVSFGDGKDPLGPTNGQRKDSFFSKVLRIDVDASTPTTTYRIPPDNPFAQVPGYEPSTYARGFRNPFRLSIDRETGDVWVGDVGDTDWEEIDIVRKGANYGWPCREGAHDFPFTPCVRFGLQDPVSEHSHRNAQGQAISRAIVGGVIYRGKDVPSLIGAHVYGDFAGDNEVWALPDNAPRVPIQLNVDGPKGQWTAFSEDADGELYALNGYGGGIIYKLDPDGTDTPAPAPRLSETGCFDRAGSLLEPVAALIPYGVNAEEWSGKATTERYFALPDGTAMTLMASGQFDMPIGSIIIQNRLFGSKRVETRLLGRYENGWRAYSYQWTEDQSDALLLPSKKRVTFGSEEQMVPSRRECLDCHRSDSGSTLGLSRAQLDRNFAYTSRTANQIGTLEHIGVLKGNSEVPALAAPFVNGPSIDQRARAYLHANCSHCHHDAAALDLRSTSKLATICNVESKLDDLGVADAKLLVPSAPQRSLLALRMRRDDYSRMPPFNHLKVNESAAALIDAWITAMTSCP